MPPASLLTYLTQLSEEHDHTIPFERFMDEALYHPDFGYYTANIQSVGGPRGDFSTSATLHPALAKAIAVWIESETAGGATTPSRSPSPTPLSARPESNSKNTRVGRDQPKRRGEAASGSSGTLASGSSGTLASGSSGTLASESSGTLARGANNESPRPSAASGCSVTLPSGSSGTLALLEVGPGNGSLARQILDALPRSLRRKTHLHLVEISPPLADLQRKTLKKYRKQITWHTDMIDAVEAINETNSPDSPVLVYSNELVDAFPPTVYEHHPAADPDSPWKKLHLAFDPKKGLREILLPSDPPPTGNWQLATFNSPQRIEVHESYLAWQTTWLPYLRADASTVALAKEEGATGCNGTLPSGCNVTLLTIDYGDTADKIYHRRPRGTLRAYHRHQRHEGPAIYARFGKQDLTTDVNFSDLIHWGETRFNLETLSLQTQADFIAQHLPALDPNDPTLDPHGPGQAFKVLIQRG